MSTTMAGEPAITTASTNAPTTDQKLTGTEQIAKLE